MSNESQEETEIRHEFYNLVNLSPKELEEWLETDESKSVGQDAGDGEAVGHKSGRRILEIKEKNKDDLTPDDYNHMRRVVSYINRHLAQRPSGDIRNTNWRYSLMNWGHDPCK